MNAWPPARVCAFCGAALPPEEDPEFCGCCTRRQPAAPRAKSDDGRGAGAGKMNQGQWAALLVGLALAACCFLLSRPWHIGDSIILLGGWSVRVPAWGPAWFEYRSLDPPPLGSVVSLIGVVTAVALVALRDRPR